jgi:hypothetical protein
LVMYRNSSVLRLTPLTSNLSSFSIFTEAFPDK